NSGVGIIYTNFDINDIKNVEEVFYKIVKSVQARTTQPFGNTKYSSRFFASISFWFLANYQEYKIRV
ncbi:14780_t:CDS:2, partial [Dentiscutata erythropus]